MAFDPEHPTFYGACLQVDFARVIAGVERHTGGGGTEDALRYLYNDTDHAWFEPGDRALIGFFPERGMLTPADEVEFALVIELRGDSTGTLRLSAGVDPAFALTDPALASESLGAFSAVGTDQGGASQIVVPVSSWTGAMIYAGQAEPFILLEALDGRPRIMQTRVRMWPPGGVTGTWESDPDYVIEGVAPRFMVSDGVAAIGGGINTPQSLGSPGPRSSNPGPGIWGGFDDMGDTGAAFADMQAFLIGHGIGAYQSFLEGQAAGGLISGGYSYSWALQRVGELPTHDWTGSFTAAMVLIAADPVTATGRQSGVIYPDPDRVPGERAAAVRDGRTGGTLRSIFVAWTSQPQLLPSGGPNAALVGVRTFAPGAEPWDATLTGADPGGGLFTYYYSNAGIESAVGPAPDPPNATQVPLPNIALVGIEVNGTNGGALGSLEFSDGSSVVATAAGARTVEFDGVRATHRFEDVQWYNPGGVVKPAREPRFFVVRDGFDRPVGFGKPEDELHVFGVQTALGNFRDMTFGEYADAGDPLPDFTP